MTISKFIAKWRKVELKERSAAQEHFIDLCNVFEHPTPAAADPTGQNFCFEKGAAKHAGGDGFADVWKRGSFGFEYKGKHKDLAAAYDQLLRYRNALENPPLLVVCDLDRIIVHTNFTGTVSATHEIALESLGTPRNIAILRAVFHDPETLHPARTSVAVTQDAARRFAEIAAAMRQRGLDPAAVAHFLDRIVFCLFAEDTRLLPDMVFHRIVTNSAGDPARLKDRTLTKLYNARPAWLADCHAKLDAAVAAAYGWPADLTDDAILENLLALNQAAATFKWSAEGKSLETQKNAGKPGLVASDDPLPYALNGGFQRGLICHKTEFLQHPFAPRFAQAANRTAFPSAGNPSRFQSRLPARPCCQPKLRGKKGLMNFRFMV